MKKAKREELRQRIRSLIEATTKDIAAFKAASAPVSPDNAIGRLTRMEAINSKSINEAAFSKAKNTRFLLEKALREIDSDGFGLCQNCEEPIAFARLMAMPETTLCITCASRQE